MADERIVFLALWVTDIQKSAAFYRDSLGVALHEGFNEPVGDPWIDGQHYELSWREGAYFHFALFPVRQGGKVTSGAEVGFSVDDVDAKHELLVARGVMVVHQPKTWKGLRTARYRDLDGNVVSFTQRL
jgi:catechol 2,3-dioxygenase-like lactoylglutathione lyase family enzyme